MAITAVTATATTGGSSSGANFTLASPAGTTTGDVLIAVIGERRGTDLVTAIGDGSGHAFTKLHYTSGASSVSSVAIWYRVVGASDGTTWTVTNTANSEGALMAYRGVDNVTPIDASGTDNSGTSATTATFNAVTTVTNNAWYIACGALNLATDNNWAIATGSPTLTERADKGNGGGTTTRHNVMIADREITTATTTDAPTYTITAASWSSFAIAVRPATSTATSVDMYWQQPNQPYYDKTEIIGY